MNIKKSTVLISRKSSKTLQSGAVLVVSLVMLLILTLIGVSGMSSVTLEEKMVSNMQNANKSFQGAEAALNECEMFLRDQATVVLHQSSKTSSLSDLKNKTHRVISTGIFPAGWWLDDDFWDEYGNESAIDSIARTTTSPDGVSSVPLCFTEYIGNGTSSMDSDTSLYPGANSADAKLVYRVTASSFGADTKSQSIVESLFVKH
ncbi:MAG: PilX N-terminal domain-containing pilus assembly protein [Pseudomonadales bacterium]|nr:PilX N-terminal domain-containing pilus assembly protein [Pseudomonadales bacterium]